MRLRSDSIRDNVWIVISAIYDDGYATVSLSSQSPDHDLGQIDIMRIACPNFCHKLHSFSVTSNNDTPDQFGISLNDRHDIFVKIGHDGKCDLPYQNEMDEKDFSKLVQFSVNIINKVRSLPAFKSYTEAKNVPSVNVFRRENLDNITVDEYSELSKFTHIFIASSGISRGGTENKVESKLILKHLLTVDNPDDYRVIEVIVPHRPETNYTFSSMAFIIHKDELDDFNMDITRIRQRIMADKLNKSSSIERLTEL